MENQTEIFRIILKGIGENSSEEKREFCKKISDFYDISYEKIEKIVNSLPVVIKKGLRKEKAERIAKTLKTFGAKIKLEKRINTPPITLEFQNLSNPWLHLYSSSLNTISPGRWNVIGRVKNNLNESLNDLHVIVQIFDDRDELITFEEAPIAINPLPSYEYSPFKVIFEGPKEIGKISIGFKNSSGLPIPSLDMRREKEWIEVDESYEKDRQVQIKIPHEKILFEEVTKTKYEREYHQISPEIEESSKQIDIFQEEKEEKTSDLNIDLKLDIDIKEEISNQSVKEEQSIGESSTELMEPSTTKSNEYELVYNFPWIESFRNSIENFYEKPYDVFLKWYREVEEKEGFIDKYHSIITIIINARFNQVEEQSSALENTEKVFNLVLKSNLSINDIPLIEGTSFASPEEWRELFYRSIPRMKEVTNEIFKKKRWDALALERLLQTIPQMGERNSRMAVIWMKQLLGDGIEIDSSNAEVSIGDRIYRVASRLGILNPNFDYYNDKESMGYRKIQSFAKDAFPEDPIIIEEPMDWVGNEKLGFCYPLNPRCEGCLFEYFCPKLYIYLNPSEIGMVEIY